MTGLFQTEFKAGTSDFPVRLSFRFVMLLGIQICTFFSSDSTVIDVKTLDFSRQPWIVLARSQAKMDPHRNFRGSGLNPLPHPILLSIYIHNRAFSICFCPRLV